MSEAPLWLPASSGPGWLLVASMLTVDVPDGKPQINQEGLKVLSPAIESRTNRHPTTQQPATLHPSAKASTSTSLPLCSDQSFEIGQLNSSGMGSLESNHPSSV